MSPQEPHFSAFRHPPNTIYYWLGEASNTAGFSTLLRYGRNDNISLVDRYCGGGVVLRFFLTALRVVVALPGP